jgi:hypothetical protein
VERKADAAIHGASCIVIVFLTPPQEKNEAAIVVEMLF